MRRLVPLVGLALAGAIGGCIVAPGSETHEGAHMLIAGAILTALVLVASFSYQALRHQQLAAGMARLAHHGELGGEPVEFVAGLAAPVVAGLWRPRIFCADDLGATLDHDELRAVVLHERHHRLDRAPLRLVVMLALAPVLSRVAAGRAWLERERARVEIAADAYALAAGVGRRALASAILKLSTRPGLALAPGFTTAADLRIRALLGEPTGLDLDRPVARPAVAVGLFVAVCVAAFVA